MTAAAKTHKLIMMDPEWNVSWSWSWNVWFFKWPRKPEKSLESGTNWWHTISANNKNCIKICSKNYKLYYFVKCDDPQNNFHLHISRRLRGYCTPGPYFWRLCEFSQKIKRLRTKSPMDLVRNVPRNSKSQFYFSRDHCCEVTVKNVRKSIFSMFWAINQ